MMILGGVLYLFFAAITAILIKNRRVGFWAMFFLSIILTPLLMAIMGLIFSKDQIKENTRPNNAG